MGISGGDGGGSYSDSKATAVHDQGDGTDVATQGVDSADALAQTEEQVRITTTTTMMISEKG